jgi:hypothetical protein
LEVKTIGLGRDGKKWNDPYQVLQTPLRGKVARIGWVVALLFLLISFVISDL